VADYCERGTEFLGPHEMWEFFVYLISVSTQSRGIVSLACLFRLTVCVRMGDDEQRHVSVI